MLPFLFWIHLIGMSIWVGASFLMPLVIGPALQGIDGPARMKAMAAISQRLSPIVFGAILLVFLSGIEQTRRIYGFEYLFASLNALNIKIIVAVLMFANGTYMGVVLPKRGAALAPEPGQPPSPKFLRVMRLTVMHGWIQFGLAIIVLLLVGFLTS